jgi:protein CpxP
MVKSHRMLVSVALVAASLLATAPAFSKDKEGCHRHHAGKMGEHGGKHGFHAKLKDLNLTEAQQAQVKEIMEKQKSQGEARWKDLRETRKALHEAARGENYDAAKVRELANKQAQLQADATVQRIETMREVYSVLTLEQKQKWDAKRHARHRSEKS